MCHNIGFHKHCEVTNTTNFKIKCFFCFDQQKIICNKCHGSKIRLINCSQCFGGFKIPRCLTCEGNGKTSCSCIDYRTQRRRIKTDGESYYITTCRECDIEIGNCLECAGSGHLCNNSDCECGKIEITCECNSGTIKCFHCSSLDQH